jgi:hypothetical protein
MHRTTIPAAILCATLAWAAAPPQPLAILRPALHQYEDGPPVAPGTTYSAGDSIFLTFEVGGFQISAESQVSLTCRVDAQDPDGVPLMASARHEINTTLTPEDKGWVPIVRETFLIPPLAPPGAYRIVMAVQDRLASRETKAELQIQVRGRRVAPSDTLLASNLRFVRAEDDFLSLEPPTYHPGEPVWVRFDIVGFKLGDKNRLHVSYGVSVVSPSGKTMYTQEQAAVEQGESFYPKRYLPSVFSLNLSQDVRSGAYTIVLTLHDEVGNQNVESKHEFAVE